MVNGLSRFWLDRVHERWVWLRRVIGSFSEVVLEGNQCRVVDDDVDEEEE